MEIPNEIQTLLKYIDNGMVYLYIVIFIVIMYLLISLLTWSFIKPLKYLSIPTILVGILLIIIRLSSSIITNLIDADISFIKNLLPLVLKPLLTNGIVCTLIGITMLMVYIIINKKMKIKNNKIIL